MAEQQVAGHWIAVSSGQMPQEGDEVPIIYKPTKRSIPRLRLALWSPDEESPGPGWENIRDSEFYRKATVTHWMQVVMPEPT